ncbi:MAG: CPBP family intramembrane glutamic endopeptidase [Opitutaceae bacterium]
MSKTATAIAIAFELSLILAGLVLFWRLKLSPTARQQSTNLALTRWDAPPSEFFLSLWLICAAAFAASMGARLGLSRYPLSRDATAAVATAAGQLGVVIGVLVFRRFFDRSKPPALSSKENVIGAGVVTFLLAMPLVAITSLIWQVLLNAVGIQSEKQDLIRMFLEAKSFFLLSIMTILACVGAPLTEELVFRAGIFRYARTRLPRWAALLLPASLFAALHQNLASFAPLVALGILFSLAYERTGRIGTSMIAHALFNLNSLVLILAKVDF